MGDVAPVVGRLDAENAVLGSLLIDESTVPAILAAVDPRDFADPGNRRIFQAARALLREGSPVDPVTIRGKLGPEAEQRLLGLMEITPTSANWREYAAAMHEQSATARIRELAQELTEATTLDACRDPIARLGELLTTGHGVDAWSMREVLRQFMASQSAEHRREYVKFGLPMLDEGTYIEPGDVLVIGGEPSSGKTALALQMGYSMAQRWKVGFFSLETTNAKLTARLAANALNIDFGSIKQQTLDESAWSDIAQKGEDFSARDMTLIPAAGMSAMQIQAESRARGLEVIIIDYVQLIEPEGDPRATQTQQVAAISRALHTFAQRSGTLVIELAQLSRPQQKQWREPDMHDLKESGQLEQDADAIFLLFRPKPGGDLDEHRTRILKIAKQKEGRLGKWPLDFDGTRQRFSVYTGPTGKELMRQLLDRGKLAKAVRRASVPGQVTLREIQEDGDEPF